MKFEIIMVFIVLLSSALSYVAGFQNSKKYFGIKTIVYTEIWEDGILKKRFKNN